MLDKIQKELTVQYEAYVEGGSTGFPSRFSYAIMESQDVVRSFTARYRHHLKNVVFSASNYLLLTDITSCLLWLYEYPEYNDAGTSNGLQI